MKRNNNPQSLMAARLEVVCLFRISALVRRTGGRSVVDMTMAVSMTAASAYH